MGSFAFARLSGNLFAASRLTGQTPSPHELADQRLPP